MEAVGMKKIKICGITDIGETECLNEAGVDYAGFVLFCPKSRRNTEIEKAKEIMGYLDPQIQTVAVVVEPSEEQLLEIAEAGFDLVQIHGRILEEVLSQTKIPVLRAFNVSDLSEFSRFEEMEHVAGYVFDAQKPGSGRVFDWTLLKELPQTKKLTFLAGGLDADNVREALAATKVDGVDTSSGVERAGGAGKDPEKIRSFVEAVRNIKE
jgi:Phosphoribosylanthranilate isomerase